MNFFKDLALSLAAQLNFTLVSVFVLLLVLVIYGSRKDEYILLKVFVAKILLFVRAIIFMLLAKDSKGTGVKKNTDPDKIAANIQRGECKVKTMVFIRHGESDWNNIFNKGKNIGMIIKAVTALVNEFFLLFSSHSIFLDSPLNQEGIQQALELREFIEKESINPTSQTPDAKRVITAMAGRDSSNSSILVSSCLRRAIATTTLGLWPRIERTKEKIHILSSLQEISRNIDTYAVSGERTIPDIPFSRVVNHCGGPDNFSPENVFDTQGHNGTKTLKFYGIKRFQSFNTWAFTRSEDIIIVGGHSLWFKYFFQTYMPHSVEHEAKSKKITNSGVVSFDIHMVKGDDGEPMYRIEPNSICKVYGGFTTK